MVWRKARNDSDADARDPALRSGGARSGALDFAGVGPRLLPSTWLPGEANR